MRILLSIFAWIHCYPFPLAKHQDRKTCFGCDALPAGFLLHLNHGSLTLSTQSRMSPQRRPLALVGPNQWWQSTISSEVAFPKFAVGSTQAMPILPMSRHDLPACRRYGVFRAVQGITDTFSQAGVTHLYLL
ncbi:hypothetical protein K438DRAFT_1831506 [Mycena galopus ATCC 62051]|nr:hypothetical protein K438DRAFT_1831506 [Mycena galopus ATCC 62051]